MSRGDLCAEWRSPPPIGSASSTTDASASTAATSRQSKSNSVTAITTKPRTPGGAQIIKCLDSPVVFSHSLKQQLWTVFAAQCQRRRSYEADNVFWALRLSTSRRHERCVPQGNHRRKSLYSVVPIRHVSPQAVGAETSRSVGRRAAETAARSKRGPASQMPMVSKSHCSAALTSATFATNQRDVDRAHQYGRSSELLCRARSRRRKRVQRGICPEVGWRLDVASGNTVRFGQRPPPGRALRPIAAAHGRTRPGSRRVVAV